MNCNISYDKILARGICTSKNVEIVSYRTHRMTLNSLIRQIEIPWHSYPLKRFTTEIFLNRFMASTKCMIVRSSSFLFSSTSFLILLNIVRLSDDNIIKSIKRIRSSWIFIINQILLFEFKIKLILPIGFNWYISYPLL